VIVNSVESLLAFVSWSSARELIANSAESLLACFMVLSWFTGPFMQPERALFHGA
jgi:hypothetical protein